MKVQFICPKCECVLHQQFSWLWVCNKCKMVWKTNEVLVKWERYYDARLPVLR